MKKILFTAFSVFAFAIAVNAQQGTFRGSVGLAYGFDIEEAGLNIGAEYLFTDEISAAPSFTTFFVGDGLSYNSINIDGKYYFVTDDTLIYGLLGLGIASAEFEFTIFDPFTGSTITFEDDDSDTGLNFGAGLLHPVSDRIYINGQLKYATAFDGQVVFQAGVAVNIN